MVEAIPRVSRLDHPHPQPESRHTAEIVTEGNQAHECACDVRKRMRSGPRKALTALGPAELLLDRSDAEQAAVRPHPDFAVAS
jgi:hypothetical protein